VEVERELEYKVAGILNLKIESGRLKYLMDWVDCGLEERTWEPIKNVENGLNAVAAFHQKYPLITKTDKPHIKQILW
jgi:hypothetical protein